MGLLVAVVLTQTAVTLLVLLVMVGLVRRLRVHSDLLTGLTENRQKLLAIGSTVPPFSTTALDGTLVDGAGIAAVALLAPNCPHCHTNLPQFIAYIRDAGYPPTQVLAVVAVAEGADEDSAAEMLSSLAIAATVVREKPPADALTQAFGARAYPCFYLLGPDRTVTAAAHAVHKLPTNVAPTPAT